VLLTYLIPSLSIWNVWDLPLWAWRSYAAMHDEYVKSQREASRGR
jgi:hypothetical protein